MQLGSLDQVDGRVAWARLCDGEADGRCQQQSVQLQGWRPPDRAGRRTDTAGDLCKGGIGTPGLCSGCSVCMYVRVCVWVGGGRGQHTRGTCVVICA